MSAPPRALRLPRGSVRSREREQRRVALRRAVSNFDRHPCATPASFSPPEGVATAVKASAEFDQRREPRRSKAQHGAARSTPSLASHQQALTRLEGADRDAHEVWVWDEP